MVISIYMRKKKVKEKFKKERFKAKGRKRGQNTSSVTRKQEKDITIKKEKLSKIFCTEVKPWFLAINGKNHNQKSQLKTLECKREEHL